MRRVILAVMCCFAAFAGQLKVSNYLFQEKTNPDEARHGDPGFRKLIDGKINVDGEKAAADVVLWRHKVNQGKAPVITFNFNNPVKLEKVDVHYFRWKRSYGIKDISLIGFTGDGDPLPMGKITLNHPYEKPLEDPFNAIASIECIDKTPVMSVDVAFTATGGYLSLNEVKFFGEELAEKKTDAGEENPMDKYARQQRKGFRIYQDGDQYVLENHQVIYAVSMLNAGSVNFAYDKLAKRNMVLYSRHGTGGYGGMFCDRLYPGDYSVRDMYRERPYSGEILKNDAASKVLRVKGTGKSGIYGNVTIEKIYTFHANSAALHVDYNITNGKDNVMPLNKGFWSCGGVRISPAYNRIYPGTYRTISSPALRQLTEKNLSWNWFGVMEGDSGLVVMPPWERLKEIYYWAQNAYTGTVECKLGIYPIKAGDTLSFSMGLVPFTGIGLPDKVTEFAAASFGLQPEYDKIPENLTAAIRFFRPGKYKVVIAGGVLDKDKVDFTLLHESDVDAKLLDKITFKPLDKPGTHVYRLEIFQDKKPLFQCHAAAIAEKGTGIFHMPAPGEKIPDESAKTGKLDLNFNSLSYETRHFKWGKPYAGGKIKVLAINNAYGGIRDMVEMAQRFDIDLTTNYIAGLWSLSGHVMSLSPDACIDELNKQLKNEYDVIVVSHGAWKIIGKETCTVILNKVKKGTGLILAEPQELPGELAEIFAPGKKGLLPLEKNAVVSATPSSPLLVGSLPLEHIPFGRIREYDKFGDVLLKSGSRPLLGSGKLGDGNVFAFAYRVCNAKSLSKYNLPSTFFLPLLNFDKVHIPQFEYHEYQMALWGRLLYAAAGRPSSVTASLSVADRQIKLETTASQDLQVNVEITMKNKFSQVGMCFLEKMALKKGENRWESKLPPLSLDGLHFVDVIIRSEKGIEWWGGGTFLHHAPARITAVKMENRVYKKNETLDATVEFEGKGQVLCHFYDSQGNEFASTTGSHVKQSLEDCRTPICRMMVLLMADGKMMDKQVHRIELHQAPDMRRFKVTQGWPGVGTKAQEAFIDSYLRQLKSFGVNTASTSTSSRGPQMVENHMRDNDILYLSIDTESNVGIGGKRPFDANKKTASKFDLVRTPCLSKPGHKEALENNVKFHEYIKYGGVFIPGPDEANMFSEWDGCFSPDCQREFRKYLQRQYASLEELNASWDCSFKTWDEVVALTAGEARQKKSFAGWVDHRTFNDWNRADSFGYLVRGMRKKAPELRYALSGSSETNPWNAWDYYLLMQHLDAMSTYEGEQVIQQRSFCPVKNVSMPWIGYDNDFDDLNKQVYTFMFNGAVGFSIYGNSNINPDFTISQGGQRVIDVLKPWQKGVGEAVMAMNFNPNPIAFYYSPASNKVNWILGLSNYAKNSMLGFRQLLEDAGLQYDYVAYGQLEKDGVPDKYKVLVLPMICALSDKEAAALEAFVRRGGTILGDFITGTYDQHGKKRKTPALQNLFGIQSTGNWEKQTVRLNGAGMLSGLDLTADYVELDVAATTGEVLAQAEGKPAVFMNKLELGKAFYVANTAMSRYGSLQGFRYAAGNSGSLEALNRMFNQVLKEHSIAPLLTVPDLGSTAYYTLGNPNVKMVAVVRDVTNTKALERKSVSRDVLLDGKYHVYDLINRKYLGYGNNFSHEFGPTTQSVFVLLPYRGGQVKVTLVEGGAELTLLAWDKDYKDYADHVFHVEMLDKAGRSKPAFEDVVFGKGNKAFYKFKKPLNATGKWRLRVTDVMTGCRTEAQIK